MQIEHETLTFNFKTNNHLTKGYFDHNSLVAKRTLASA